MLNQIRFPNAVCAALMDIYAMCYQKHSEDERTAEMKTSEQLRVSQGHRSEEQGDRVKDGTQPSVTQNGSDNL